MGFLTQSSLTQENIHEGCNPKWIIGSKNMGYRYPTLPGTFETTSSGIERLESNSQPGVQPVSSKQ